jgi:hypothetical protein
MGMRDAPRVVAQRACPAPLVEGLSRHAAACHVTSCPGGGRCLLEGAARSYCACQQRCRLLCALLRTAQMQVDMTGSGGVPAHTCASACSTSDRPSAVPTLWLGAAGWL